MTYKSNCAIFTEMPVGYTPMPVTGNFTEENFAAVNLPLKISPLEFFPLENFAASSFCRGRYFTHLNFSCEFKNSLGI